MNPVFQFLKETEFCREMPDADIMAIVRHCHEGSFEPKQVVFYENEDADRVFLILMGEVEVWKAYGSHDADMLAVLGKGRLFGEMALIDRLPRSATVISSAYTRVLYIEAGDFQTILTENAAIALSMVRSLSAMVRKSNENFLEDLKVRNRQLEEAYDALKKAQDELLRQERLSNLGKFSSMILHDIRNPIQVIKMYLDILRMGEKLPEPAEAHLSTIRSEADRLNGIANELLDYSRGEIRLSAAPVDCARFMARLEDALTRRFRSGRVVIDMECHYRGFVVLDQERMLRVLLNLADNSRKAMGNHGRFAITARKEQNTLVLLIADDGEGMSAEILGHIFEPFYSCSRQGGTGLGMLIVKSIVEAHGGTIEIDSAPCEGTRIRIALPLGN